MRQRVTSNEPRNDSRQSNEAKGAGAFLKSINTLDFNARHFAFVLYNAPLVVKRRIMSIMIGFIVMNASDYDNFFDALDPEQQAFAIECKKMQEVMTQYSIDHNEFME